MTDDPTAASSHQTAAIPVVPPGAITGQGGNAADVPIPPAPSADAPPPTGQEGAAVTLDEIEVSRKPAASIQELAQAPLVHDIGAIKIITPGKVDLDHGSDAPVARPEWNDIMSAQYRSGSFPGGVTSFFTSDATKASTYVQPGYNPWEDTSYEDRWEQFVDSTNPGYTAAIKRDIDKEIADRKTVSLAPMWQRIASGVLVGIADPTNLLPAGELVTGTKGGMGQTARGRIDLPTRRKPKSPEKRCQRHIIS